ncbi:MAG: hypothetical protein M1826_002560 [Phylliscum demangeonii]|nr:MAG: hypothetical protein M1826_002560 [Phylliscum demangeonii]
MPFSSTLCALLVALVATAQGHMLLAEPVPMGASSLQNGPINQDNYPCQSTRANAFDDTGANTASWARRRRCASRAAPSTAVSITYDKQPTAASVFKVIHSIVGGCPAKNQVGNLPADPNGNGADTYEYKIPTDIPTDEATLAWTWFNKIGNREMYMNCARITITASGSTTKMARDLARPVRRRDQSAFDRLPDMFKANIGSQSAGCSTKDSADVNFPNPGQSVDHLGSAAPVPPVGSCGTQASGSGSGSASAPAPVAAPSPSSATVPATSTQAPAVFMPTDSASAYQSTVPYQSPVAASSSPSPAASPAPADVPVAPSSSPSPAASPAPADVPVVPSSSPSPAASPAPADVPKALIGPCNVEGIFVCLVGGKHYQECGSGHWTVAMPMAPGTACAVDGNGLAMLPVPHAKRHVRFSHGHAHRRG